MRASSNTLFSHLSALALAAAAMVASMAALAPTANAATPGAFETVLDDSLASAMMMGVVDENTVFILDKAENNRAKLDNGKTVWGSIVSLNNGKPTVRGIDVTTNTFCATGLTLGNGSWVVVGGNQAVSYGGAALTTGQDPSTGPYQVYDGRKAVRILNPAPDAGSLAWNDNTTFMTSARWYPGMEGLPDGSVLIIGGATGGGYINRNTPNIDPAFQATGGQGSLTNLDVGGSNPTWEIFPLPRNFNLQISQFMVTTSGLNMYPHTYLMPSGLMFMQANYSTILWNYTTNTEYKLPDMPGQIVRVYPASGATAMMPLTPENKYTPTILFCGGIFMTDEQWGNYTAPVANTHTIAASNDCHSITPETATGQRTNAQYVQEDNLPEGRSMGQFIHLPDETMVIVNGANKGTSGYGNTSFTTVNYQGQQIQTEGLAQDPVFAPVLYDPSQPKGSRFTRANFGESTIARLYHSTAVLLADGSVMIGGSNPHQDVSLNMPTGTSPVAYNTEYRIEKWYPSYWNKKRPTPQGLPNHILFGGKTWNFTIGADFNGGAGNFNGNNTKVMVIRPGFSTHAMNFGQRSLRLAHTYTVNEDGSVMYMVNPMPTNQNLFVAGPALLFITVNGVPSMGKMVTIGHDGSNTDVPTTYAAGAEAGPLPAPVLNSKYNSKPSTSGTSSFGAGKIAGIAAGAAAIFLLIGLALCFWRRRANRKTQKPTLRPAPAAAGAVYGMSNYSANGAKYDRVQTPTGSMHAFAAPRGSVGTFDSSYHRGASGGQAAYFDNPRHQQQQPLAHSPLADPASSPSPQHGPVMTSVSSVPYQQSGWGEHQAAGDVGAEYYRDASYTDPSKYYDTPASPYAEAPYAGARPQSREPSQAGWSSPRSQASRQPYGAQAYSNGQTYGDYRTGSRG